MTTPQEPTAVPEDASNRSMTADEKMSFVKLMGAGALSVAASMLAVHAGRSPTELMQTLCVVGASFATAGGILLAAKAAVDDAKIAARDLLSRLTGSDPAAAKEAEDEMAVLVQPPDYTKNNAIASAAFFSPVIVPIVVGTLGAAGGFGLAAATGIGLPLLVGNLAGKMWGAAEELAPAKEIFHQRLALRQQGRAQSEAITEPLPVPVESSAPSGMKR
jgi:hypothetical protein